MPENPISLIHVEAAAEKPCEVTVDRAVIAGWTGRDPALVEKHMAELEALGVARPPSVPVFYRVSAARLTTAEEIEVTGTDSGGEVEFVLLRHDGRLWAGVGSDHTDRAVETYQVTSPSPSRCATSRSLPGSRIMRRSRRTGTGWCCAPGRERARRPRFIRKGRYRRCWRRTI